MAKILMILSAADSLPLRDNSIVPGGFWAQELVEPYHIFMEHGHTIDIATPRGKPAVLDETSLQAQFHNNDPGRVLNLREQLDEIEGWRAPLSIERLAFTNLEYGALFFPGGYGPLADLASSSATGNAIKRITADGGLIGAVCHGQAALLPARHDGRWLFAGYQLTCFSHAEESAAGFAERLEWLLAERLQTEGGEMTFGTPGSSHVVIDRQLYTGQNPASAGKLAFEMARSLKKMSALDKAACGTPCD